MKRNWRNRAGRHVIHAASGILLLALSAFFTACGNDPEYRQIDFTPKISMAHPESVRPSLKTLRVAVAAMISPKETSIYYRELIDYLSAKIDYGVELIQRKTYAEVNELLARGHIDIAFICTGPYVTGAPKHDFEAIATPVIRGNAYYQSYLIVHKDSPVQSISDLRGRAFAFTDPESNTGSLVPRYWLWQLGVEPETHFSSFTYTYSHDNSIMAVAKGLVDAAAVDGHMWEYYQHRNPFYTEKTKIIKKSEPFGSPPVVVSRSLDPVLKSELKKKILSMHEEPEGRTILDGLMIDRFTTPEWEWYAPVKMMIEQMATTGNGNDAS